MAYWVPIEDLVALIEVDLGVEGHRRDGEDPRGPFSGGREPDRSVIEKLGAGAHGDGIQAPALPFSREYVRLFSDRHLAEHLKDVRQSSGKSQKKACEEACGYGVSLATSTLSRYERCENSPTMESLLVLSRVYEVPVSRFFESVAMGDVVHGAGGAPEELVEKGTREIFVGHPSRAIWYYGDALERMNMSNAKTDEMLRAVAQFGTAVALEGMGHHGRAAERLEALCGEDTPKEVQEIAALRRASVYFGMGARGLASDSLQRLVNGTALLSEPVSAGAAWLEGCIAEHQKDLRRALARYQLSHRQFQHAEDLPNEMLAKSHLASLLVATGRSDEGLLLHEEVLANVDVLGIRLRAAVLRSSGRSWLHLGDVRRARVHLDGAVGLARDHGYRLAELAALLELLSLSCEDGEPDEIRRMYSRIQYLVGCTPAHGNGMVQRALELGAELSRRLD